MSKRGMRKAATVAFAGLAILAPAQSASAATSAANPRAAQSPLSCWDACDSGVQSSGWNFNWSSPVRNWQLMGPWQSWSWNSNWNGPFRNNGGSYGGFGNTGGH
ncbi:hypothetical protein, partial [Luedemannella flava]|uniref:hypothetical protein n=1 Tax=Luedemannella flava TaxID=349316 RepID=UPI0031D1BEB0